MIGQGYDNKWDLISNTKYNFMKIHQNLIFQRFFFYRRFHIFSSVYFLSLVNNCNHKGLGIYYLLSSFIFGISGTLISVLIRIELYSSGNRIISPENQNFYNINITLHGFLMIFFLLMPGKYQWEIVGFLGYNQIYYFVFMFIFFLLTSYHSCPSVFIRFFLSSY